MSDPFANLLQSFKQGAPPQRSVSSQQQAPQVSQKQLPTNTNTASTKPVRVNGNLNETIDNLHIGSVPLVPSRSTSSTFLPTKQNQNQTSKHDDLDDLFGLSSAGPDKEQQEREQNAAEHIDDFGSEYEDRGQNQNQNQDQEVAVVDEVKDMELAQLMSLGLSFEKALDYYDSGVLYEDLLRVKKERQQYIEQQSRRSESPRHHKHDTGGSNGTGSLFSMAANLLNKGKELVDQLTAYPEDTDRLTKYAHMYNYEEVQGPQRQRGDHSAATATVAVKARESSPNIINRSAEVDLLTDNHDTSDELAPSQNDLLDGNGVKDGDIKGSNFKPHTNKLKDEGEENILLDFSGPKTGSTSGSSHTATPASVDGNAPPRVAVSHIELSGYEEFNKKAKEAFVKGDYITALDNYTKSLNTLPQTHPLRIVALSNMIITQIKVGDYAQCIENAKSALQLFPEDRKSVFSCTIQDSNPARTYKEIWSKIMLRQAEAYEHQESYKSALAAYQELMENGFHDQKVMAGKSRCQRVLRPTPARTSSTPVTTTTDNDTNIDILPTRPRPRPIHSSYTTASPSPSPSTPTRTVSTAAESLKAANLRSLELENQRLALHDKVQNRIDAWKDKKQDDIRYLLANLQQVLTWADWKPVSQTDLVMPKRVKATYLRAMTKVHPDKLGQSLELESRMVAENVFSVLSTAWEKFKLENNMN